MELREVLYWEDFLFRCGAMKSRTKNWRCDSVRKSSWRIHPNSQPASKIRRIWFGLGERLGKRCFKFALFISLAPKTNSKNKTIEKSWDWKTMFLSKWSLLKSHYLHFQEGSQPFFFSWGYLNQGWDSEECLLAKDLNVWLDVFFRNWSSQMVEKLEVGELCVF